MDMLEGNPSRKTVQAIGEGRSVNRVVAMCDHSKFVTVHYSSFRVSHTDCANHVEE